MTEATAVLVVDEDPAVLRAVSNMLRFLGVPAGTACGGAAAVSAYREHRTAIRLVLIDLHMAEMDGPEALAALRAIDPAVRCWFMTIGAVPRDRRELLGMGAGGVLYKPFTPAQLKAALSSPTAVEPA